MSSWVEVWRNWPQPLEIEKKVSDVVFTVESVKKRFGSKYYINVNTFGPRLEALHTKYKWFWSFSNFGNFNIFESENK